GRRDLLKYSRLLREFPLAYLQRHFILARWNLARLSWWSRPRISLNWLLEVPAATKLPYDSIEADFGGSLERAQGRAVSTGYCEGDFLLRLLFKVIGEREPIRFVQRNQLAVAQQAVVANCAFVSARPRLHRKKMHVFIQHCVIHFAQQGDVGDPYS